MLIIGIAGGSGSGKSTIAEKLKEYFGSDITVICHDSYYRDLSHLSHEQRCAVNFDHPSAYDTPLLCEHLRRLSKGESISTPIYDYTTHKRSPETQRQDPRKIIVVEGILIFENEELRSLFDMRIFIDTEADIRLLRRIRRDVQLRARSIESVLEQYEKTVKPMHDSYVEPTKKYAHLVISEGAKNADTINSLVKSIKQLLTEKR